MPPCNQEINVPSQLFRKLIAKEVKGSISFKNWDWKRLLFEGRQDIFRNRIDEIIKNDIDFEDKLRLFQNAYMRDKNK